jgi:hypothetical protein
VDAIVAQLTRGAVSMDQHPQSLSIERLTK